MLAFNNNNGLVFAASSLKKPKDIPKYVEVMVEVPQGGFVKRKYNGSMDVVIPCPCPFNYGSVPSLMAPDGDPLDAIILGNHLPYGHIGTFRVKGMLKFIDSGLIDNKLICVQKKGRNRCAGFWSGIKPLEAETLDAGQNEDISSLDWLFLCGIFSAYAVLKTALNSNSIGGVQGPTSFQGFEFYD